ncbi:P3H2 hydroxylase, partial [Polypterus senegalus]
MTAFSWTLALLTTLLWLRTEARLEPFDLLYDNGVEAFYSSDYERVVFYMEKALSSYWELRRSRVGCTLSCEDQYPFSNTTSDLPFFDVVLRRAACLNECLDRRVGAQSVHRVSEDVIQDFNRRTPYNFLQLAYYKQAFSTGVKHYDNENYEIAIKSFEEALVEYFKADVECRALCEGPQKFEDHAYLEYQPHLHKAISDHYTQVLACKHECVRDLATRPGRLSPMENYLPLHYDYLQFAYFKAGKMDKALECALSYLLFHEGDEFLSENVDFYRRSLMEEGISDEFKPRQDVERYVRRHKKEVELLRLGSEIMELDFTESNYWSSSGGREDINRYARLPYSVPMLRHIIAGHRNG